MEKKGNEVKEAKAAKHRKATRAANGSGSLLKRGRRYYARFCVGGKIVERALHTDDEAEARAALQRLAITYQGIGDRQAVDKIVTVRAASLSDVSAQMKLLSVPVSGLFRLFEESPTRRAVGARTLEAYRGQANVFTAWLAKKYPHVTNVRDISQGIADEYVRDRASDSSPNTVNKDLNLFAMIWRTLSPRFGLEYNPWTPEKIARKPLKTAGRRALTDDEVRALLKAAGESYGGELRLLILVGRYTAYRLHDVVTLEWGHVDLGARWIERVNAKTGKVVGLPIARKLLEELAAWREKSPADAVHVFPVMLSKLKADGDTENVSRIVTRLMRSVGIETSQDGSGKRSAALASFHSLRHTFVTRLIEGGVDPMLVKESVGHSTIQVTSRYTHIGEKALRAALDAGERGGRRLGRSKGSTNM